MSDFLHIKNFYKELDIALNSEYQLSNEFFVEPSSDLFDDYYDAFKIEAKTMASILSALNLKYSVNLRLKEFEYNSTYKNGKIVFINLNDIRVGYFEYVNLCKVWYLTNVHILPEFRNYSSLKILYNSLIVEMELFTPNNVIVVCQKINKYIKSLFQHLSFTYIKDLNSLEEIWIIDGFLFKQKLLHTLGKK